MPPVSQFSKTSFLVSPLSIHKGDLFCSKCHRAYRGIPVNLYDSVMAGKKIAVAIIHGIGKTPPDFAEGMKADLLRRFTNAGANPNDLIMKSVYWSPVLQGLEDELSRRTKAGGPQGYGALREFMVSFAADAIAYQPAPHEQEIYEKVHQVVAQALRALAEEAGPTAPLCVIAHSLGTIVASNYFYDLQTHPRRKIIADPVETSIGDTPLDWGETLSLFYTLGSPLALWSLRYTNFGSPLAVPAPALKHHWPALGGEWINYYDKNDVIGYPLKTINAAYSAAVKEDRVVSVGNLFTTLTPLCHTQYWTDRNVTSPLATALVDMWKKVNPPT